MAKKQPPATPSVEMPADEGWALARDNAVKYLHGRRQAMFALARRYHLDAEDIQQEAFEVLLTCLRDFNPQHLRADGSVTTVQFNTFFGARLEGKALELRNKDPEYQARQAHMADMDDGQKAQFRENPPLLVQHLDQETAMQETLRGEASGAMTKGRVSPALRIAQDSLIERKLNQLIAAERDDKRRAALLHVKVGGIASFEEIAYHFGVTDSRASQILNDLMDAFYVQRLVDGDVRSVAYDFKKLKLNEKRALRLLKEALHASLPARAAEVTEMFAPDYPSLRTELANLNLLGAPDTDAQRCISAALASLSVPPSAAGGVPFVNGVSLLTPAEKTAHPEVAVGWHEVTELTALPVLFRNPHTDTGAEMPHIGRLMQHAPEHWPLLVTPDGKVIDGWRRLQAAKARGIARVMATTLQAEKQDAQVLRVALNFRALADHKAELFFAIQALLGLGLSQQKISQILGTSRPNVIVYAKVIQKADPALRQLYLDGLILITNASSACDLPADAQQGLAAFIRQYGAEWTRGPKFNQLYEAAATNGMAKLIAAQKATPVPVAVPAPVAHAPASAGPVEAVDGVQHAPVSPAGLQRMNALEQALRDAETWAQRREATVGQQTQQILDLKTQVESLQRELSATQLLQHADDATMAAYVKELKLFLNVIERLKGAQAHVEGATKAARSLTLTFKQRQELDGAMEAVAAGLTALRTAVLK